MAHISRKSSKNGLPSNLIQIFRSERSEAQTFCVPFNNLTVLAELMESAHSIISITFIMLFNIVLKLVQ
jgi:hypothetical protein